MPMLCSLSAAARQTGATPSRENVEVHSRSLEYTAVLPAGRQRARDAASSILNLAEPALPP